MGPEQTPNTTTQSAEETEGVRWLKLLDEERLTGTPIPYYYEGRQLRVEEFPLLDGYATSPLLAYIESLAPDDPKRQELIDGARQMLYYFLSNPKGED